MKTYSYAAYLRGELAGCITDEEAQHPYRPTPGPHGELVIDPEIVLKAKPFPVQISFYYSTTATVNKEYGPNRSASVRSYILDDSANAAIWAVRGDLNAYLLTSTSSSGLLTNYECEDNTQGVTTFAFNSSTGQWVEYFPDGYQLQYEPQVTATPQKYCLTAVVHPSGVPHTYSYGTGALAGLLVSIEEAAGRLVSFNYGVGPVTSLVNSVEDWAGRLYSFTYDAHGNVTGFTTPTGCETQYTYLTVGSPPTTLISSIEDPNGYITGYRYNTSFQVVTMSLGTAIYSYTYGDSLQTMESPTGAKTTYLFNTDGDVLATQRPEGYTSTYAYGNNRFRISETRPSGLQRFRTASSQ